MTANTISPATVISTASLKEVAAAAKSDRAGLHVLYLTMGAGIGGGSISLLTLMEGLQKCDVSCSVVLPEDGPLVERYERIGVPCYVMNYDWLSRRHPLKSVAGYRLWHRLLRRISPDVIHVNALPAARPVALVAWSLGIPWICHCRFPPEPAYASWLLRRLPKPRAVLFNSEALQRDSGPCLARAWPSSSQFVVHNAVDVDRFHVQGKREHWPPRVGIVGNLSPVKAHEVFIAMAAQLAGEGVSAEYLIVGRDKGSEADLRALVARENLGSQVKFLGYQEDVPSVLAQLDVLVCCSHRETFGRCVVEAMAAGLPVVATRVGGLPEVVDDGVTGLLVPPRDPPALALAAKRLLDDPSLRRDMGSAGQKRAVSKFGSSSHAKQVLNLYSQFVKGTGVSANGADGDNSRCEVRPTVPTTPMSNGGVAR